MPDVFFQSFDAADALHPVTIKKRATAAEIIADLSEPRSVQAELQAIVPNFQSIPVVALINRTGKEYALFSSLQNYKNVVSPTVRYRDLDDLLEKLDLQVVHQAEQRRSGI